MIDKLKVGDRVRVKYERDIYTFYQDSYEYVKGEVKVITEKFIRVYHKDIWSKTDRMIRIDKILDIEYLEPLGGIKDD